MILRIMEKLGNVCISITILSAIFNIQYAVTRLSKIKLSVKSHSTSNWFALFFSLRFLVTSVKCKDSTVHRLNYQVSYEVVWKLHYTKVADPSVVQRSVWIRFLLKDRISIRVNFIRNRLIPKKIVKIRSDPDPGFFMVRNRIRVNSTWIRNPAFLQ